MSLKILLVEDNPADADFLQEMLAEIEGEPWHIIHVERLKEALDHLNRYQFDLVLLDLSLPDAHGLETITKTQAAATHIPIVVLTGADDENLALQAVAVGAQDYLMKGKMTVPLLVHAAHYAIERAQILKQLQDSERRFRGVFNQTFQLMGLLTPQGILLEVNQSLLDASPFPLAEIVHCWFWDTAYWNYSQETQAWLKDAVQTAAQGEVVRKEVLFQVAIGKFLWLDFSLKPLKDETEKVILLIAEGRDISDRKQAEAQILAALEKERELNQLKSDFVSMVSHEFRTPLTTIRMSSELLQYYRDRLTEERQAQHFERINQSISQMLQLLDEVLLLARGESGRLQFSPVPLDVEDFCRELIEELQINDQKTHSLVFTCSKQQPVVMLDENLLRHILINLLANAMKYSPQDSTVWLGLTNQEDRVTIQVRDEGIGIPLKDQQHLFETFYRASNVGQVQGTGLGLAITKQCVELHGGQIEVESEVGIGTTFTVTLTSVNPADLDPEDAIHYRNDRKP